MNKYISIAIILGVLLLIAGGLTMLQTTAPTDENVEGETVTRNGTVVLVDTNAATYDGPVKMVIADTAGVETLITVPSMGLPLCVAYQKGALRDPFLVKAGEVIEVRGALGEDGSITPCQGEDHYLR